MKKLYSISELINENIKLKKKIQKDEIRTLKNYINLLQLSLSNNFDTLRVIRGFEEELRRVQE